MHEVLLNEGESANRPFNPMIDHVGVQPLDLETCWRLCTEYELSPRSIDGLSMLATITHVEQDSVLGGDHTLITSTSQRSLEGDPR